MRIRKSDYELLDSIHTHLLEIGEFDTALLLARLLNRLATQQDAERRANKERASRNRAEGYKWKSSYHPKKSKYQKEAK